MPKAFSSAPGSAIPHKASYPCLRAIQLDRVHICPIQLFQPHLCVRRLLGRPSRGHKLTLFTKTKDCSALRAYEVSGAHSEIIFLRKRRMRALFVTPLQL